MTEDLDVLAEKVMFSCMDICLKEALSSGRTELVDAIASLGAEISELCEAIKKEKERQKVKNG